MLMDAQERSLTFRRLAHMVAAAEREARRRRPIPLAYRIVVQYPDDFYFGARPEWGWPDIREGGY
jgi:hypothetical protein